ncbi:hypothetical protein NKJ28_25335 [Mesorhizobium sp. M0145]
MLNEGRPAAEIARLFRVHRATVGRLLAGPPVHLLPTPSGAQLGRRDRSPRSKHRHRRRMRLHSRLSSRARRGASLIPKQHPTARIPRIRDFLTH